MGDVYLAATRGIEGAERPCVVKTIRTEHVEDASFRARFLDETRIQAQLQHPGVAQILEATTTEEDHPYAVVEYVEGRHLGEILSRSNQLGVKLEWADAVAIAINFGDALAHVHERTDASGRALAIAHRDLSPQNVMLGYAGDLKLIDFGTAKGENRRCRTVSGIVYAKPGYVAPEVANQKPGGPPADLYAFGVMIWEVVSGRRFLQGDAVDHQVRVAKGELRLPPLAKSSGAPQELDRILARLTDPDLAQRYPSARRAVSDLVNLLKTAPSLADGDRSVRGRIAQLMQRLYPAEPARSRADFARRVMLARRAFEQTAEQETSAAERPGIPDPSPAPPSEADQELAGILPGTRYRLLEPIARGGMGEVHKAMHLDLGRTVALKVIPQSAASSTEARQRFRSEARAVARLDHPGLVNIHDFGITSDGRCYYSMELLSGETLQHRLSRGPLPWKEAVRLVVEATSALGAAHQANIVHRDITPANLFLTEEGVKLLDFGVARSEDAREEAGPNGPVVVGTPEYLSPEQAAGAEADARSDIYALGVVLYEALCGQLPHRMGEDGAPSLAALLTAKITLTPEAPSKVAPFPGMPAALDRVVLRMLERDAEKRYASCSQVREALDNLLLTVQRPRRRWIALSSAAAAFVAVLSIGMLQRAEQPVRQKNEGTSAQAARPGEDVDATVSKQNPTRPESGAEKTDEAVEPVQSQEPNNEPAREVAGASRTDDPAFDQAQKILRSYARGRKISAHHEMKELAEQYPDSPNVQRGLVTTARGVRAWGEAIDAARVWVRLQPTSEARVALAKLQHATLQGDPVATLRQVVEDDPDYMPARVLLERYSGEKLAQR